MPDNSLKIGACAGLLAGASTGFKIGTKKSNAIMKPFLDSHGKISPKSYVRSRLDANEEFIRNSVRASKISKAFHKIRQKARVDFKPTLEKALSDAKRCKIKSTILFAAVGLTLGLIVDKLFSNSNKKEA